MVDDNLAASVVMVFVCVLGVTLVVNAHNVLWAIGVFFGGVIVSLSILGGSSAR
jgi:hypothetical protein